MRDAVRRAPPRKGRPALATRVNHLPRARTAEAMNDTESMLAAYDEQMRGAPPHPPALTVEYGPSVATFPRLRERPRARGPRRPNPPPPPPPYSPPPQGQGEEAPPPPPPPPRCGLRPGGAGNGPHRPGPGPGQHARAAGRGDPAAGSFALADPARRPGRGRCWPASRAGRIRWAASVLEADTAVAGQAADRIRLCRTG